MSKLTKRPGRYVALIGFFNVALVLWLIIRPASNGLVLAVDNMAQFVGPLLVLPLCFGNVLRPARAWRERRWAPILLGLGVLGIVVGQMIFSFYEQILHYAAAPFPGWSDAFWLSVYPLLLLGVLLIPSRALALVARTRVVLDGIMIMTAIVAFSWYFVLGPTILGGTGSLFAQIVGAAYPFCDLVLVFCLLLLSAHVTDPNLRRVLRLLQLSLVIIVVADTVLGYENLHNAYHTGSLLDVGWPLGYMLVGLAGGQLRRALAVSTALSPSAKERTSSTLAVWRALLPYAFVPAVAVLALYAWFNHGGAELNLGVYISGGFLIALVVLRQVFALLENRRLMAETAAYADRMDRLNQEIQAAHSALSDNNEELQAMHSELAANNQALVEANTRLESLATTDPLTSLPNHRALVAMLDHELERGHRYGRPCSVLFLDLDHFKALNDSYGHAVGDATLRELASVAQAALRGVDILGRWGGEEFLAILPETGAESALLAAERVRSAVAAHTFGAGGGAHLTCSIGLACYPHDAEERDRLIELADQAMYAAKRLGRNQVRATSDPATAALIAASGADGSREEMALAGTVEALAALVEARDQYTGSHTHQVAALTLRIALTMGLDPAEARMVELAGRLHDVGKIAVPDAILRKPARLTDVEWAVMRTHSNVGADVVSRVPTLRTLAPLIRSHHEHWDGCGYPDGAAGAAIPLGARIIAVADAYEAMTTERPYQSARVVAAALDEMRRCAGTQFDPDVVAALEAVLALDVLRAVHKDAA